MQGNGKPIKMTRISSDGESAETRLRQLLTAMVAFRDGDFSVRLPADWPGIDGRIAEAFNQTIVHEDRIAREVRRLSVTVGKEGRLQAAHVVARRDRRLGDEGRFHQHADRRSGAARQPKSPARSAPWPRATWGNRWSWRSTDARLRASFCARRSWSTR